MPEQDKNKTVIEPYGGELVDLLVKEEERDELLERSNRLPSVQISPRALCDLELLATGAFSPWIVSWGKQIMSAC